MIALIPILAAATTAQPSQADVLNAINQSVSDGDSASATALWLALAVVALGLSLLFFKAYRSRSAAAKPRPLNDPKKLLREVRRSTGLSRRQLRSLRRASRHLPPGHTNPLLLSLCPSLNPPLPTRKSVRTSRLPSLLQKLSRA